MEIRRGSQPATTPVRVDIDAGDWELHGEVNVPDVPMTLTDLLPVVRGLSEAIVSESARAVESLGACVSCKAGCGACCRMMVAVSEVEARRIDRLVENLPEPRRSEIEARFAAARRKLEESGLLPQLLHQQHLDDEKYSALATAYFKQQIACPFLEDESCSIYEERPVTCREYLVTSPPENCANPSPTNIRRVHLPLKVFNALARWQVPPSDHFLERWVPLILAPEWARSHPDDPPPRPGPELLSELLGLLNDQVEGQPTPPAGE
jgi:Fe-S-cluster containining protein